MAVIFFENERVVWGTVYRGAGNVVLGSEALEAGAATESELAVTGNTAVGLKAGAALKEGTNNTAIGAKALTATTVSAGNVAVGQSALEFNKTGSINTAVGSGAMAAGAGGEGTTDNVAVGASSLLNAVGKKNVAIGVGALFENKSGDGNVAIGQEAGEFELGSNKLYIANSNTETPLIKGDFSAKTLTINGQLTATVGSLTKLGTPMRELAQL